MSNRLASDASIALIREAVMVAGRWSDEVERVVCTAIEEAYESGLSAASAGRCRSRIVLWVADHEGEGDWTHARIAEETGMTRETANRQLSRLRLERLVIGPRPGRPGYLLTTSGRAYAAALSHIDDGRRPYGVEERPEAETPTRAAAAAFGA